jgi:hypothetical protein
MKSKESQIRHDLQEPVEEEPETLEGAVRTSEPEPATIWPTIENVENQTSR